jgi:transposase
VQRAACQTGAGPKDDISDAQWLAQLGAILAHLDFLEEQIDRLSDAITAHLDPQTDAGLKLAATITGVAQRTAEVLVAEIGTDMTVFPSARHLASWPG